MELVNSHLKLLINYAIYQKISKKDILHEISNSGVNNKNRLDIIKNFTIEFQNLDSVCARTHSDLGLNPNDDQINPQTIKNLITESIKRNFDQTVIPMDMICKCNGKTIYF